MRYALRIRRSAGMPRDLRRERCDPMVLDLAIPGPRGYTLLEMVVVVAIFAMVSAFIVPIGELFLRRRLEHDTRAEMRAVKSAILAYYRDVGAYPAALGDLATKPDGATGWVGPYLTAGFTDESATDDDFTCDAWRHRYLLIATSVHEQRLRSLGENGLNDGGHGDDIDLRIDVSSVLRDLTQCELEEINIAVRAHNAAHLPDSPLPISYAAALAVLQTEGFLPSGEAATTKLSTDAWGQAYETRGPSPVMEVVSIVPD